MSAKALAVEITASGADVANNKSVVTVNSVIEFNRAIIGVRVLGMGYDSIKEKLLAVIDGVCSIVSSAASIVGNVDILFDS